MTYHPDQQDSSLPYNWYRKLAEMMNKPTASFEDFNKDAAGNWLGLIGLKPTQGTKNLQQPRESAEELNKLLGR